MKRAALVLSFLAAALVGGCDRAPTASTPAVPVAAPAMDSIPRGVPTDTVTRSGSMVVSGG
jgi:uncharacterized lipoprotein YajG